MLSLIKRLFGRDQKTHRSAQRSARIETTFDRAPAASDSKASVVDSLDNPDLDVVPPPDTGFDPYNTGTFNRSGSWERINKRRSG